MTSKQERTRRRNHAPTRARSALRIALPAIVLIAPAACVRPISSPGAANRPNVPPAVPPPSSATDGEPAAGATRLTVNGDTVTARQLWWRVYDELEERAATLSPDEYRRYVERRAVALIRDAIAEALLYRQASLRLPKNARERMDRYVEEELRKVVATEHDGVMHRFVRHLESRGQTLDDVRERLRREIMIANYLEVEVKPKVPEPTRAELLAAYEEMADSLRKPERRRMSLIDVRISARLPDDVTEPTRAAQEQARAAALERIRTAQTEIQSGVSFAEVARKYSDGLHADEGGSWNWITPGSLRDRFVPAVEALYQLDEGQVSDIIETTDGFFLARCDEIDPAQEPDFQSVQPRLREGLFQIRYNREVAELITSLQEDARIIPEDLETFHAAVVAAAPDYSTITGS